MGPGALSQALAHMVPSQAADLIVGLDTGDDALVWRRPSGRALVATTDFFAPIVDDPVVFGRIAATNAVSDIYAMGGSPLFALNIVGWPADQPLEPLADVLAGGQAAASDGGWVVAGGHTIDAPEPFYGQAIVGEVDADRVLTNAGAIAGQSLILTKPLGIGVAATASKSDPADDDAAKAMAAAIDQMLRSNSLAKDAALAAGATACTDVTGFGLLGHLAKMMRSSGCTATVNSDAVPRIDGVASLVARGFVPGGTQRNLDWLDGRVGGGDAQIRNLFADPQTSGGLLFACPSDASAAAVGALVSSGHSVAVIGTVAEPGPHDIELV